MSRMPAIGTRAVEDLARALETSNGQKIISAIGTVPDQFKYGKQSYPIPRIIRQKLAERLGIDCIPLDGIIIKTGILDLTGEEIEIITDKQKPETAEELRLRTEYWDRQEKKRKRSRRYAMAENEDHPLAPFIYDKETGEIKGFESSKSAQKTYAQKERIFIRNQRNQT